MCSCMLALYCRHDLFSLCGSFSSNKRCGTQITLHVGPGMLPTIVTMRVHVGIEMYNITNCIFCFSRIKYEYQKKINVFERQCLLDLLLHKYAHGYV
jgi:hypothetical protein